MGRSVNKVTLIGTLGRDPEVRYMPNGNAVANLAMATDESYNDKQTGQKVEQTEWHRLVVYGKLAEIVQQYLKKGSKAYFEGRLKTREWEKDGVKRYTTEIVCNDMMMLTPRADQPQAGGYQQPQPNQGAGYGQQSQSHTRQGYQGVQPAPQQQPRQAPPPTNQPQGAHMQGQHPAGPPVSNQFDNFDDDIPY